MTNVDVYRHFFEVNFLKLLFSAKKKHEDLFYEVNCSKVTSLWGPQTVCYTTSPKVLLQSRKGKIAEPFIVVSGK